MPVAEAQRRISSREFAEWLAYLSLDTEPAAERRQTTEEAAAVLRGFTRAVREAQAWQ